MKIRYLSNNIKLDEHEKKYLAEKIKKTEKLLSIYKENELSGEIEVNLDKRGFFRVEIMIKTPHNLFRVDKTGDALMSVADMVEEALMKQIRRKNEKMRDLQRRGK